MPNQKRGFSANHSLSWQQSQLVLKACENRKERVVIGLPLFCGLRAGEVAHLKASWVTPTGNLKIPAGQSCDCTDCKKRKKPGHWQPKTKSGIRELTICQTLYDDLIPFLKQTPDGLSCARVTVYHIIKAILKRSGMKTAYPHALRATNFNIMVSGGITAPELAAWAGWNNLSVAQNYINMVAAGEAALKRSKDIFNKLGA